MNALTSDYMELVHTKLCNAICDILSVKRIAIKNPGGIQNNDFRSPNLTLVHGFCRESMTRNGEFSTWAQRIENGIIQTWDITKCMFSIGNISEKLRVASFSCENEVIVDLFAGIGYFVLPYLIHAKAKHVYACEWNPASVIALKRNLQLNRISNSKYTIFEGDNRLVCPANIADRLNLGLIPSSEGSYETAVRALRDKLGGILHIHGNVRREKGRTKNCDTIESNAKFLNEDENQRTPQFSTDSTMGPKSDKIILHANSSVSDSKYDEWKEWSYQTAQKIGCLLNKKDGHCTWVLTMIHLEHVKAFAPFVDHMVLDIQCKPIYPLDGT
jgi:tRNA wybutosine-synthesizing protein 2